MFTKLPLILRRTPSHRPYSGGAARNPSPIKLNGPKYLEIQIEAAILEGLEQKQWEQELNTYNKVKTMLEPQATEHQEAVLQTMTPKEASAKSLDVAFSQIRGYLGDTLTNFIEPPLRAYAFPKLEKAFTYLAKDGRVSKNMVDNVSKYALYMILTLASLYVYEKIKSHKEEIETLEKEIQELEKQYTDKIFEHSDIRDEILKRQKQLLAKQDELERYTNIIETLGEIKKEIALEAKKQTYTAQMKDQFFSVINPDGYEKEKVKSHLIKRHSDTSTGDELDKWASVHGATVEAREKITKIRVKCDNIKQEITKLESESEMVAQRAQEIGEKLESKQIKLNNKWCYSFFSHSKEQTKEEIPTPKARLEF